MTTQTIIFTPAARQAQADFRAALEALARPGTATQVSGTPAFPVSGAEHAYSLLLALADQEVTIGVLGGGETVARFASLGTGSRIAPWERAGYVLCLDDPGAALRELQRGDIETPELGATAIIFVEALGIAGGLMLTLSGPGIAGFARVSVSGLSRATIAARNEACAVYPQGIDLFLIDSAGACIGMPRTTTVTLEAD